MSSRRTFALTVALGCGLAAISQWRLNRPYEDRCQYDGVRIQPIFRVDWSSTTGTDRYRFCCICCAGSWMKLRNMPEGRFSLRDEVDGTTIDARSGYFVESHKATETLTGCRIHVFRDPLHAHAHLLQHQGKAVRPPF